MSESTQNPSQDIPINPDISRLSIEQENRGDWKLFLESIKNDEKWSEEFKRLIEYLGNSLVEILDGQDIKKAKDLRDFFSDPSKFSSNPSLYKSFFYFLDTKNIPSKDISRISKDLTKYFIQAKEQQRDERNDSDTNQQESRKTKADNSPNIIDNDILVAWKVANDKVAASKEANKNTKGDIEKINQWVSNIKNTIWPKWNARLDVYVQENKNNESLLATADSALRSYMKDDPQFQEDYIAAQFLIRNELDIQSDLQNEYREAAPEKKKGVQDRISQFTSQIWELRLIVPSPVNNVSNEVKTYLALTRATETARIQAEKLEKTHDVYRDGTSLYFVNKSDPKDIKRIDILVDRAVYTVMKNGLSLSTDLTLVTHEEKEKREAIRKVGTEHEKAEWAYQKTLWEFLPIRAWEYEKKIAGTEKTGMEILRSRGGEWVQVQEAYDDAERQLMRLNPENAKSWERTELIQKMKEQTERLKTWNQWFFILKEFGGTEKDIIESDGMKTMFEQRSAWLRSLGQSIEQSETRKTEFEKAQKWFNPDDTRFEMKDWNESARWYLSELTSDSIGLNGLSDESFQALLTQLKQRDIWGGIWKEGILVGSDGTLRDNQQKELRSFSQKVGGREGWQKIEKQLHIDGTLANRAFKWDDRQFQKWIQSLDKPQSETP